MKRKVVYGVIIGLVITLITGVINTTPYGLVGATWYGFPAAWRIVLVTATPATNYHIVNFILDWIFWIVVALVLLMVLWKKKKE